MNAQEALDELKKAKETLYPLVTMYDNTGLSDEVAIILKDTIPILQQLIDQANAKPKTLEELGWTFTCRDAETVCYERQNHKEELETSLQTADISKDYVFIHQFDEEMECETVGLSQEDVFAIAEKMKELGMDQ